MASVVPAHRTRLRSFTRKSLALLLGGAVLSACTSAAPPPTAPPGPPLPTTAATTSASAADSTAAPSPATASAARTAASPSASGSPTAPRATAEQVEQAVKLEQIRGHLIAAVKDTQAGRVELARAHTEHPIKEEFPAIAGAVKAKDAALAEKASQLLTNDLKLLDQQADAKQFESAVADTNKVLDDVQRLLIPSPVARDLAFQGNVLAALLDVVAEEYGEGVHGGTVTEEVEYQDAYEFFQRGRVLWHGFEDQVKAKAPKEYEEIEEQLGHLATALKDFTAPAAAVPPEQVVGWTMTAGHELAEVTGFEEAGTTTPAGSPADQLKALSQHLDVALDALKAGDVAKAKQEYQAFDEGWEQIEDGVRAKSRDQYRAIEDAMGDVQALLLTPATPENGRARVALEKLDRTIAAALPALR